MKIPLQEKIAELESRIVALEKRTPTTTRTVTTTRMAAAVDLEPEMGNLWSSVEALFKKAFK